MFWYEMLHSRETTSEYSGRHSGSDRNQTSEAFNASKSSLLEVTIWTGYEYSAWFPRHSLMIVLRQAFVLKCIILKSIAGGIYAGHSAQNSAKIYPYFTNINISKCFLITIHI